jgi:peptidoglycan/LPS O-acetylase OafA/YrhL
MALLRWLGGLPARYGRVVASTSYVPQIDGLRFLAILQVVIYHAALRGQRAFDVTLPEDRGPTAFLSHGVAGVELFFFISGYIIAYPFLAGNGPSYGAFIKRRLTRLEPPYVIALLGCFALLQFYHPGANAPSFHHVDAPLWQSLAASLVYMHGLIFGASPRLNPPLWSLELEIQFYLLAPFLVKLFLSVGSRARRAAIGVLLVLALGVLQVTLGKVHRIFDYTILTHGYAFMLGILVCDHAIATRPFEQPGRRIFDLGLAIGVPLFILSGSLYNPAKIGPVEAGSVLALRAAAILLIYFAAVRGVTGRRVFGSPWIALIGGACYSIYLTHIPVLQATSELVFRVAHPPNLYAGWLMGVGLLIPFALVAGMIYYLLIERPCMQRDWPSRLRRRLFGSATGATR